MNTTFPVKLWSCSLIVLACLVSACSHRGVELVRDGQAQAEIIVPTEPLASVRVAAEDLQTHLELISGAKLAIVQAPTAGVPNQIYVGESEHTKALGLSVDDLPVEGFRIVVRDSYVALIGHDVERQPFPYNADTLDQWHEFAGEAYGLPGVDPGKLNQPLGFRNLDATATLYAVSDFLEQLGVRWYHPYEDGTVIPSAATIEVPEQELRKEPAFPYREFTYYGWMRSDKQGIHWFKRLKYGTSYAYKNNHTTWAIVGPEIQRERHPEYYAKTKDGKIIGGYRDLGVPLLSSESLRKTSLNFLDKTFAAYPQLQAMSLGMPDGFTRIDAHDAERWVQTEGGPSAKYSNYVWDYWLDMANRLKEVRPDKYLACLAYSTYLAPPSTVDKLPENVAVTICYGSAFLHLPTSNELLDMRGRWLDMLTSRKLYVWDYYRFYAEGRPRYPVVYTKQLQKDMQMLHGVCEGKFVEIYPHYSGPDRGRLAAPGLSHLLHYLQGKLYWDPDLDLEALLSEYYELYFGPASAEMRAFYEFAEEAWMRPESRTISTYSGFLKEADVDRYFELLTAARARVKSDSVYDRRIAEIEEEMQPLKKLFPNLKRTGPEFRGYRTDQPYVLDGKLDETIWTYVQMNYPFRDLVTGELPRKNGGSVTFRLVEGGRALLIGIQCEETQMDQIVATAPKNDDYDIFNDDAIEVYLETPERSYFKIAVTTDGKIWDESRDVTIIERDTLPLLWDPGVEAAVHKGDNGWSMELKIPTGDFGVMGPDKQFPWGINVCRTRWASGEMEFYALSPTGRNRYADLTKLGNLWTR